MLSQEENETLTRVGPGTPGGEMFRRYWHPIYATERLHENPVAAIRILGENLVLFRNRNGGLGLIDERCPHRQTKLCLGIPEPEGLRCCYHGWLFDGQGHCLEMPLEPADSEFKNKVKIKAYPVEEMGGLIWAYLGQGPAPPLPRWDLYVRSGGLKTMVGHRIPTNWLQVVENQADPGHIPYGHGRFFQYALERKGMLSADPRTFYNASFASAASLLEKGLHVLFKTIPNEFGFTVGRKVSDETDDTPGWRLGSGARIFPTTLSSGPGDVGKLIRRWYQVVVPIDDVTTWQFQYFSYFFPEGVEVPEQNSVPYTELAVTNPDGSSILDYALGQDVAIFIGQGEIADRTKERLGTGDSIVLAYRKLLREQIDAVSAGAIPINVFRDADSAASPDMRIPGAQTGLPARNATHMVLDRFHERSTGGRLMIDDVVDRHNRDRDLIVALYEKSDKVLIKDASQHS